VVICLIPTGMALQGADHRDRVAGKAASASLPRVRPISATAGFSGTSPTGVGSSGIADRPHSLFDKVGSYGRLPKRAGWFRLECPCRHREDANIVDHHGFSGQVRPLLVARMTHGW
jgi:hypothetical protein